MRKVSDLQCGQSCRVKKVHGHGPLKRRFNDMGITNGAKITLVRKAPFGDPLEIRVKGCHVCLRLEDARQIELYDDEDCNMGIPARRLACGRRRHMGCGRGRDMACGHRRNRSEVDQD